METARHLPPGAELPLLDPDIYDINLVGKLIKTHEEDFYDDHYTKQGMNPEQKKQYLEWLAETARNDSNINVRKAAEIFLKKAKGEINEN